MYKARSSREDFVIVTPIITLEFKLSYHLFVEVLINLNIVCVLLQNECHHCW